MKKLTVESAAKLQRILSKRFGRVLIDQELEEAYHNLMEFAAALVDLTSTETIDTQEELANQTLNDI